MDSCQKEAPDGTGLIQYPYISLQSALKKKKSGQFHQTLEQKTIGICVISRQRGYCLACLENHKLWSGFVEITT